jgi:membrane-associated protease RseP (regulator of RpoE activity)
MDIVIALFIALAIHEAGHALAARQYGVPVSTVRIGWPRVVRLGWFEVGLLPIVGWVLVDDAAASPRTRLWLALAGPLASLLLAPLIFLPGLLGLVGLVSVLLAIANLLPIPPLDGGRVMLEALEIAGVRVNRPVVLRGGLIAVVTLHALLLPPAWWLAGMTAALTGCAVGFAWLRRRQ